jgi:uroporphyrinogen-III synthase
MAAPADSAVPLRLVVTRPAAQAEGWVQALRAHGLDAVALPLIGIAPPEDPAPVIAAWQQLPHADLVMFVSANAVQQFFALRPPGLAWPESLAAAATGPGTSAALRAAGVALIEEPPADAAQFDSEALWARLSSRPWVGRRVWVVRGEQGRDWLADTLRKVGASVRFVAAYRRLPPLLGEPEQAVLSAARAQPARHVWLFSSSEAVSRLGELAPEADWSGALAWCSHPRIEQAARQAGFGQVARVGADLAAVAARAAAGV